VLKSAEALSARFLLLWTLGDSTNLIGCAILIQMDAVIVTQVRPCICGPAGWLCR